eukprot:TRINITY_DN2513_c0_g1_i3.p1 TRINITY_DN2513_c0_g1~~TRINITY_DN2513_c0_g1_i3.p1  ORF type:complete len:348 (+),score=98.12 TRINITY_DN2513_c0_g1_i3:121-1164(+)
MTEWEEEFIDLPTGETRLLIRPSSLLNNNNDEVFYHPVLIYQHGMFLPTDHEEKVIPQIKEFLESSREEFTVIRVDARGQGKSSIGNGDEKNFNWEAMGKDMTSIMDLIDNNQIQTIKNSKFENQDQKNLFVLSGLSMGCAATVHSFVQESNRLSGLVLILAPTAWDLRPKEALKYKNDCLLLEEIGLEEFKITKINRLKGLISNNNNDDNDNGNRSSNTHNNWNDLGFNIQAIIEFFKEQNDKERLHCNLVGAATSDFPNKQDLITAFESVDHRQPVLILPINNDGGHPLSVSQQVNDMLTTHHHVNQDIGKDSSIIVVNNMKEFKENHILNPFNDLLTQVINNKL